MTTDTETGQKFAWLRSEWQAEIAHSSAVENRILHPAYLRIIGMGKDALPHILAELEAGRLDHWFPALRAITGVDPVSEEDEGNMHEMAVAWVTWGKKALKTKVETTKLPYSCSRCGDTGFMCIGNRLYGHCKCRRGEEA